MLPHQLSPRRAVPGAEAGAAPRAAASRSPARLCSAQRHGEAMAGAAAGAGLGRPDGAAAAAGQVRGSERGPGRAAPSPPPGAGRLRAVAAGQVPGRVLRGSRAGGVWGGGSAQGASARE